MNSTTPPSSRPGRGPALRHGDRPAWLGAQRPPAAGAASSPVRSSTRSRWRRERGRRSSTRPSPRSSRRCWPGGAMSGASGAIPCPRGWSSGCWRRRSCRPRSGIRSPGAGCGSTEEAQREAVAGELRALQRRRRWPITRASGRGSMPRSSSKGCARRPSRSPCSATMARRRATGSAARPCRRCWIIRWSPRSRSSGWRRGCGASASAGSRSWSRRRCARRWARRRSGS